jgi:hypothetical protein
MTSEKTGFTSEKMPSTSEISKVFLKNLNGPTRYAWWVFCGRSYQLKEAFSTEKSQLYQQLTPILKVFY